MLEGSIRRPAFARKGVAAALSLLAATAAMPTALAQAGLFGGFSGSWSGDGTITMASGASDPIRCRATYVVENNGTKLRQDLRCASDSYSFDVESEVSYNADAGIVSGTWHETNYSAGGFLSGRVRNGGIEARVEGGQFAAAVDVVTNGDRQSVSIRPEGSEVSEVAVSLRRKSA